MGRPYATKGDGRASGWPSDIIGVGVSFQISAIMLNSRHIFARSFSLSCASWVSSNNFLTRSYKNLTMPRSSPYLGFYTAGGNTACQICLFEPVCVVDIVVALLFGIVVVVMRFLRQPFIADGFGSSDFMPYIDLASVRRLRFLFKLGHFLALRRSHSSSSLILFAKNILCSVPLGVRAFFCHIGRDEA